MIRGAVPGRIRAAWLRQGYTPVRSANRLGEQVAEEAYPLVNRIPSSARASILWV